jgi:hypothetical protein
MTQEKVIISQRDESGLELITISEADQEAMARHEVEGARPAANAHRELRTAAAKAARREFVGR